MKYRIHPLAHAHLDRVRLSGLDAWGQPVVRVHDVAGAPLRCCLRNALPGEECILFGYEPPIPGALSPYREVGAVFAHAEACGGPSDTDPYPCGWFGRPQILRAYDSRGWIHPASMSHDGSDPVGALNRVFAEPGVVEVHSRNVVYGCFMFAARAHQAS